MNELRKLLDTNKLIVIVFLILILFSLLHTNIHIDEARYLTVAWEMDFRGDYIVPHLNGEPYSHKPPLLFWITNLIWAVTGPHLWAARLIPILFVMGTAFLLVPLSKALFPHNFHLPILAQKIFLSSFVIILISQLFMFDTLMMFWVTAACLLISQYHNLEDPNKKKNQKRYPFILGSVLGLAVLTKGPVIFVYVLPFIILQQLIFPQKSVSVSHGIVTYLTAISVAAIIGLSWALIAAHRGGDTFAEALLWKQTAHRLVNSTYHQRPWWFYGVFLPLLFLPSIFLPAFLSKIPQRLHLLWKDQTCKFLILWITTIVIIFSLISCKQLQYLLPIGPLIVLLIGRYYGDTIVITQENASKNLTILLGISLFIVGALLPYLNNQIEKRLPLKALSKEINNIQKEQHRPMAFMHSRYHGEFGYLTKQPHVDPLLNIHDLNPWFSKNPTGFVMAFIPRNEYAFYQNKYAPFYKRLFFKEGKGNYYVILEKK